MAEDVLALDSLGGFRVLRLYLERYWERGDRQSEDLADLLSSLDFPDDNGIPLDRAEWEDWNRAWQDIATEARRS